MNDRLAPEVAREEVRERIVTVPNSRFFIRLLRMQ
jgi:hypothetical protein